MLWTQSFPHLVSKEGRVPDEYNKEGDEGFHQGMGELKVLGVVPHVQRLLHGAQDDNANVQHDKERLRPHYLK